MLSAGSHSDYAGRLHPALLAIAASSIPVGEGRGSGGGVEQQRGSALPTIGANLSRSGMQPEHLAISPARLTGAYFSSDLALPV